MLSFIPVRITAYLISIFLFFGIFVTALVAETKLPNSPETSAIAIMGRGVCGSGFYLEGGWVVTNAHVTRSVCEFGKCLGIQIFQGALGREGFTKRLEFNEITLDRVIPSLDLSLLKVSFKTTPPDPLQLSASEGIKQGDQVTVIGFPGCSALVKSEGFILEKRSDSFTTSAAISKGSSGSAVLGADGSVVGVVTQSASIYEGLSGLILGLSHRGRAVDARLISLLLQGENDEILAEEVKIALLFYKENVSTRRGFDRLIPGIYFSMLVEKISERLLLQGEDPLDLKLLLSSLDEFPQRVLPGEDLKEDLELLGIAYALEGPADFLQPRPSRDSFLTALRQSKRSEQHLSRVDQLLGDLERSGYGGIYPNLLLLIVSACGVLLVWAASLGVSFCLVKGSLLKKVFLTALVALALWPLSFLLLLLYTQRQQVLAAKPVIIGRAK